ncbi:MAG: hypothetical protein HXX08_13075 [Chloroflexi bacterium]|uniref:Lipoprotein n=1 Tax=Candidatus Chlorohelix allophototropha TaxID=3003348 RepID=A0A8T7M3Z8_9CHLR|nr:hypothetical protein [Chloroflexota bacterium]WJW70213.1 hypothetical protein OZ401_004730 [Chloroflexota bacterium L227-S17]
MTTVKAAFNRLSSILLLLIILSISLVACGESASPTADQISTTNTVSGITSTPVSVANTTTAFTTNTTTATGSIIPTTTKAPIVYITIPVSNDARQSLEKVADDAVKVRGLNFTAKITTNFMTPDAIGKYAEDSLKRELTLQEISDYEKSLLVFGFTKPGFDYVKSYTALLEGNVAGFYDYEIKKLFVNVADPNKGASPLTRWIAEHELTHALQDQNFGIEKVRPQRIPTDKNWSDDKDLAVLSLIEGDAVQSQFLWTLGKYLSQQEITQLVKDSQDAANKASQVVNQMPPILLVSQTFPYEEGWTFVQNLYKQGGWDAVNKAWTEYPPVSSSQILNFDKYKNRVEPIKVDLSDLTPVLGAGWRSVDLNTMGEYTTRVWLKGQVSNDEATKAASGWAGDRYQVLEKDGNLGYVWRSKWDNDAEAKQFFDSALRYITPTYNLQGAGGNGTKRVWQNAEQDVQLIQKGTEVLVLVMPKGDAAAKIISTLGF